jgi:uncharacterized damage-inducible protein DinB
MTKTEFCIATRKAEFPAFVRVLKALPQSRLDYRPDPKARTAAELAWVIADEEAQLLNLVETGVVDWKEAKPPSSVDEIAAAYEKNANAVTARLEKLDEAGWQKNGKFLVGGQPVWETTIDGFVWGFLLDAIHHRGQLSTYIRPMGGKVPSIYGPSGDDPGKG